MRRWFLLAPMAWAAQQLAAAQTRIQRKVIVPGPPPPSGSTFSIEVRTSSGYQRLTNPDNSLIVDLVANTIKAVGGGSLPALPARQDILISSINQLLTLTNALSGGLGAMIFRNGQLLTPTADYTISGTSLAVSGGSDGWGPADITIAAPADVISVVYFH